LILPTAAAAANIFNLSTSRISTSEGRESRFGTPHHIQYYAFRRKALRTPLKNRPTWTLKYLTERGLWVGQGNRKDEEEKEKEEKKEEFPSVPI
jgi:hypothetical protein